jgi:hypothetical protein
MLAAVMLSGCSGGGSSNVPSTAAAQTPTSGNSASVQVGTLNLMQSASTVPVQVTSRTPASPTVDVRDQATVKVTSLTSTATMSNGGAHAFAGGLFRSSSSAKRAVKDVAANAPYDLSYHGNYVLGSAVAHNLFVNCDGTCRTNLNFQPGVFQHDLNADPFLTILYQYLTSPGVVDTTPLTGSYTKGTGADLSPTYSSPQSGDSNPYYGQLSIWLAVLNAAGPPGAPTALGGGGLGHIYHVFLPKNVDTCFESPPGTSNGQCYSPDNNSTFYFCAYHGAFTATNGNGSQTYLYTVEPYQDVPGCRNNLYNQGPLPNAVPGNPSIDPADPGYSTLSHETFETITDPLLRSWYNNFSGGSEIGDICAEFDNFVTLNGHPYVLQSEYSDLHHVCVSATLSAPAQTPQPPTY